MWKLRFDRYIRTKNSLNGVRNLMAWMGNPLQYCHKGPYFVLSFFLLLLSVLSGFIFESVLKSIYFSNISATRLRTKNTNKAVWFFSYRLG